jgi:Aminoglycoside N3''-acetyltransferase
MNEEKYSIYKLLHLINNYILIVGVPMQTYTHILAQFSAPALDGIFAQYDYEFLKLLFPIDPDIKIGKKL